MLRLNVPINNFSVMSGRTCMKVLTEDIMGAQAVKCVCMKVLTEDIIGAQAAKCVCMKVLTEDIMGAQAAKCVYMYEGTY